MKMTLLLLNAKGSISGSHACYTCVLTLLWTQGHNCGHDANSGCTALLSYLLSTGILLAGWAVTAA